MSEQETPFWDPNKFYAEPEPNSNEIKPTEEAPQEPENVETEELRDETIPQETQTEEEAEETAEESAPQLEDDEMFVTVAWKDDETRDISLADIKKWEKDGLRQSDYTKKTQKLAEERRAFDADKQAEVEKVLSEKLNNFDDTIAELEALIAADDELIDWEDLRQYDLDEYTKQKERKEKRVQLVADAKLKRAEQNKVNLTPEEQAQVQQTLIANNPEWLKDGEQTEAHTKDMKLLADYLVSSGYTVDEQNRVVTAKHWQTLIDAARWNNSVKKVKEVKKAVKKVPLTPKPKKTVTKPAMSRAERFYNS